MTPVLLNVKEILDVFSKDVRFTSLPFKPDSYFVVHLCTICSSMQSQCSIHHSKNANYVCNVSGHREVMYWLLGSSEIKIVPIMLQDISNPGTNSCNRDHICYKNSQGMKKYITFTFLDDNVTLFTFSRWRRVCVQKSKRTHSSYGIWFTIIPLNQSLQY